MPAGSNIPQDPYKVNSLVLDTLVDPVEGQVKWDPVRSLWNFFMLGMTVIVAPFWVTWGAVGVSVALGLVTLCAGHSVGFHRRLIHRTFKCSKWLERLLVWLGTLVGMQGPLWMIRTHDYRDWAQRQPDCHDYLAHRNRLLHDGWWNLHCRLALKHPPRFDPGPDIANDWFYRFLQRTWMAQQLPLALLLYFLGGWPWVIWGTCVRIFGCVSSHWFVGYLCHTVGPQSWLVINGAVQAHNVPWAAILSFGESWHNNHHAFPASAKHGLYPGQLDLGYQFILLLKWFGLAWDIQTPDCLPRRNGIAPLVSGAESVYG